MNQNRNNTNRRDENDNQSNWATSVIAGATLAGVAALAGGIYYLASGSKEKPHTENEQQPPQTKKQQKQQRPATSNTAPTSNTGGGFTALINSMSAMVSTSSSERYYLNGKVASEAPPENPVISNLNALLADIHVRYIQLRDDDFRLHYNVFDKVFRHLHEKMMEVDAYYRKYHSMRQFAGSHYDNLRIKKPDEFDMDFVIRLPLNISEATLGDQSDITIEPQSAGFVHLRMGTQFQRLPQRDGIEWMNNKAAYEWMDDKTKYLLRSKFMDWWKSVVNRALNTFQQRNNEPIIYVDGVEYTIARSESGPAMTLFIQNRRRGFKLDVDLVPALKFPEARWPITNTYRQIPRQCRRDSWMVVGKPDKTAAAHGQERSWRIALHYQERGLMHNSYNMRQAIRLMKKLRDEQGMKKIASYYIKTLFFLEIVEQNSEAFWRNNPAFLFKHMVEKLHSALVNGNIPYFWNKRNNLIGSVDRRLLSEYAAKLVPLMQVLQNPGGNNYKLVAKYLLSPSEFKVYNERFLHI